MSTGSRPITQHMPARTGAPFPIWLVLVGNGVMMTSLWLIAAGGMSAKILLLGFWAMMLAGQGRRIVIPPGIFVGLLMLVGLLLVVASGSGAMIEKLRLIGNILMLPVGLAAGAVIGRACVRVMMPALLIYLPLSSAFYITHEGLRLNQPFLFLGLFALCSVTMAGAGTAVGKGIGAVSGIAVLLSQTRIAVLAMLVNAFGLLRLSRAKTWFLGFVVLMIVGVIASEVLPRLSMTHSSGRLLFWRAFADIWIAAPSTQQWLGFGAGAVEDILSGFASFSAFGALHNDHFRILFETGIVGALFWILGWIIMIWRVHSSRLAVCILLSVALTMMTDNTLNYGHYLMCCGLAAGIALRSDKAHG